MPGIVGYIRPRDESPDPKRLATMAAAMVFRDGYERELEAGSGWGLGRVTLGQGTSARQPVWNEDRTVCLVMEGELYGTEAARRRLAGNGYRVTGNDAAGLLLGLYLESPEQFADDLNGAYTAAVFDGRSHKLCLVTDHLGQRPLYYAQYGEGFYFASSVASLLADGAFPRQLDATAVSQMLAFEQVLADRTLLRAARLAPAGSVLSVEDGRFSARQYWSLSFPDTFEARSDDDYLEALAFHTREAVARHGNHGLPAVQMLSGGLDSRQLLGALAEIQPPGRPETLRTLTMGEKGCSDRRPAEESARKAGALHRFFELTPDILPIVAQAAATRLDGLTSAIHTLALAPWLASREPSQIVFKGFFGDSFWIARSYASQYSDTAFVQMLWRRTLVLFDPDEQTNLLLPAVRREMDESLEGSFRSAVARYTEPVVADRFAHFILAERQRRFIQYGVEGVRTEHIVRTPFTDREYTEFALSVPTHLRVERQIQLDAIVRMYPELAKVPWEMTGLPMMSCTRDSALRMSNSIRWLLRARGLSWVRVWQRVPLADYDVWMRGPLRPWVEDILLNPATLARGLFNPEAVRRVVAGHMSGLNNGRKLSLLLTLELWLRRYMD